MATPAKNRIDQACDIQDSIKSNGSPMHHSPTFKKFLDDIRTEGNRICPVQPWNLHSQGKNVTLGLNPGRARDGFSSAEHAAKITDQTVEQSENATLPDNLHDIQENSNALGWVHSIY